MNEKPQIIASVHGCSIEGELEDITYALSNIFAGLTGNYGTEEASAIIGTAIDLALSKKDIGVIKKEELMKLDSKIQEEQEE